MECPECGTEEMELIDDSFDYEEGHHGPAGTEVIKYWKCPHCNNEEDYEGEDEPEW